MQELIKVTTTENGNVVSARELHQFLEVKTDFTDWCKRMFEYGFENDIDFILLKNGEKVSKSNPIDYALTLDTSKEIAMLQRSEKGKEARKYFIECEKQLKEVSKPKTQIELIIESAIALQQQEQRLAAVETKLAQIENIRIVALSELNHIERSTQEVPEIGIRLKVNQIVRSYSEKTGITFQDIWRSIYSKMLYTYRFNVNAYKKLHEKESKLDIIERENQMDNLFALVSKELS